MKRNPIKRAVTKAVGYQTIDTTNFIRLHVKFRVVSLAKHWRDILKGES